ADAVILDLEDGVAPARKTEARKLIRGFLQAQNGRAIEWLIRLNGFHTPYFEADLEASVRAGPDALVIPKVDSPELLQLVDGHLTEAEHASALPPGSLRLFALIESARGILNAPAIATATSRLEGLILGHVDLSVDLGIRPGRAGEGIVQHARCQLVLAGRAAGVDVVDTICLNIRDSPGSWRSTRRKSRSFTKPSPRLWNACGRRSGSWRPGGRPKPRAAESARWTAT
ncbi:MAG: CoA ester lyase, partial [candidate division NC10 bacterium]|nr:CoA ester lyase [candidate division NC10 bacterium]